MRVKPLSIRACSLRCPFIALSVLLEGCPDRDGRRRGPAVFLVQIFTWWYTLYIAEICAIATNATIPPTTRMIAGSNMSVKRFNRNDSSRS